MNNEERDDLYRVIGDVIQELDKLSWQIGCEAGPGYKSLNHWFEKWTKQEIQAKIKEEQKVIDEYWADLPAGHDL